MTVGRWGALTAERPGERRSGSPNPGKLNSGKVNPGKLNSGERGSGTVLVAAVMCVLMAITAAILVVGGYLVAADRARGAADLVAVSAAAEQAGLGEGCRAAAGIARLNGVELVRCVVDGDSLDFVISATVRQPVRLRLPLLPDGAMATSHAGRLGVVSRG